MTTRWLGTTAAAVFSVLVSAPAWAQETGGPLLPHVGGRIATSFSNAFGPDSESELVFTAISPTTMRLTYASARGLKTERDIRNEDIRASATYVLGFSDRMPRMLPGTTSLGLSAASLEELRDTGRTRLSLVYDEKGSRIDGELSLVEARTTLPVLIEEQIVLAPALHARGTFGKPPRTATGEFYFLANKNNPMMLQSALRLS